MRLLHRLARRQVAVLAAVLVAFTLVALMVVMASGEEDPSDDRMDVKVEPTSTALPVATPDGADAIDDAAPDGARSTTTTVPARSRVDDPDRPVSSDDPTTPPRPVRSPPDDGIDSFEECAAAGYPIAESYPEQCFTPDGRSFTRVVS